MRNRHLFSFIFSAMLLTLLLGCGNDTNVMVGGTGTGTGTPDPITDPPGGIIGGVDAIISGEWGTSATEAMDTCGFDPFPPYAPMMIEESGGSVIMTEPGFEGACVQSVRTRSGNTVTLQKTDTFDGGCGIVQVQSVIVYEFTDMAFSGTSNHHYTTLAGNCSNLPCDYNLAVGGTRCDGCWTGCSLVQDEEDAFTSEVVKSRFESLGDLSN